MKQPYLSLGDAVWSCLKPARMFADMKNLYKVVVLGKIYTVIAKDDNEAKRLVADKVDQDVTGLRYTLSRIATATAKHECGVIGVEDDIDPEATRKELFKAAMLSGE